MTSLKESVSSTTFLKVISVRIREEDFNRGETGGGFAEAFFFHVWSLENPVQRVKSGDVSNANVFVSPLERVLFQRLGALVEDLQILGVGVEPPVITAGRFVYDAELFQVAERRGDRRHGQC